MIAEELLQKRMQKISALEPAEEDRIRTIAAEDRIRTIAEDDSIGTIAAEDRIRTCSRR